MQTERKRKRVAKTSALDLPKQRISRGMPHYVLESYQPETVQLVILDTRMVAVWRMMQNHDLVEWIRARYDFNAVFKLFQDLPERTQFYEEGNVAEVFTVAQEVRLANPEYSWLPDGLVRYLIYNEYLLYRAKKVLRPTGHLILLTADSVMHLIRFLADNVFGYQQYRQLLTVGVYYSKRSKYKVHHREVHLRHDSIPILWYTKTDDYTFHPATVRRYMRRFYSAFAYGIPIYSTSIIPVACDKYRWASSMMARLPQQFFHYLFYLMTMPYDLCLYLQAQTPQSILAAVSSGRLIHLNVVPHGTFYRICLRYLRRYGVEFEDIKYGKVLDLEDDEQNIDPVGHSCSSS
jgi:hypothetical protein